MDKLLLKDEDWEVNLKKSMERIEKIKKYFKDTKNVQLYFDSAQIFNYLSCCEED